MTYRGITSLFLLCLGIYLANGRPHPEVDCVAAPYMAWSLVRHGTHELQHYPHLERYVGGAIRQRPDGVWVSMRPPGSAWAAVPVFAPVALFREQPLDDHAMNHLGKLAAALCVAFAAVLFFLVCQRLAPGGEWPATILFALGTCLCSVASQALWMHGPAVFWLCLALYWLTMPQERFQWSLLAGLALGLAVLTRPSVAFFALAAWGVLVFQCRWRAVLALTLGGLFPAIVLLDYNFSHFGHALLGGYENDNWAESPPWWLSLSGLLIAPSRGVLVYSPALVLVLPGFWVLLRSNEKTTTPARPLLLVWFVAALATLVFYSRWHDWRGGWCYGPRLLCETMPILCLLVALAYAHWRSRVLRGLALVLVGLSVGVHLVGIFGYNGYAAWQHRHTLPDQGWCLFSLEDTQIEAHARALWGKISGDQNEP